jgi:hypothetical protein
MDLDARRTRVPRGRPLPRPISGIRGSATMYVRVWALSRTPQEPPLLPLSEEVSTLRVVGKTAAFDPKAD